MSGNDNCKLSVIIVSFNSAGYLYDCLDSLIKNPPRCKFEIVVVDNASKDASVSIVKKSFPDIKLIENKKNLGFARANNIAIRETDSRYILLLNSDCCVYKKSLDTMIDFMERNEVAGVEGPRIINSDGSVQYSCRRFPSFFDAGMHSILENIAPDNPFSRRYKLVDIKRDSTIEVDWVSGSCMMIRRAALDDTGLLDEKYFMYVEDTDLCYQMWLNNWKVFYNPDSQILHHIGGSTDNGRVRASVQMQRSALYFFWKNNRNSIKILVLPLLVIVLGLRILLTFIKNLLK
jgi:GT2 family glycosyltransferase